MVPPRYRRGEASTRDSENRRTEVLKRKVLTVDRCCETDPRPCATTRSTARRHIYYLVPHYTRGQDVPSTRRTRPHRKQTNETNRKHTNLTAIVPASQRARPQTYTWSNMEANAPPQPQSCVTFGFCEECVTVLCFNNRGSSSASASAAPQGKLEVVVCASHARLSCWCVSRL